MSANKSNLSKFEYDLVVATTLESINATMKEYLYNTKFDVVKMYWNADTPITLDELMKQTNGIDPLTANWDTGDPLNDILDVSNSDFNFAFEVTVGIPDDMDPQNIPGIVTLQQEWSQQPSVIFNLICSQFKIVAFDKRVWEDDEEGVSSVLNVSQPAGSPWLFTAAVPLQNIIAPTNTNLPSNVQQQLSKLGSDVFSVQQLLFDLDKATLEVTPTFPSNDNFGSDGIGEFLSKVFLGAYFSSMKAKGQPVLNYALVAKKDQGDPSTLNITDIKIQMSPYADPSTGANNNSNLNMLNYLCSTHHNVYPIPLVEPFSWNWVEQSEASSFNGVVAINRNTFANHYVNLILPLIDQSCLGPYTKVRAHAMGSLNFEWSLTPNQTPTVTINPTGAEVIKIAYENDSPDGHSHDKSGLTYGEFNMTTSYSCTVSFQGNTVKIVQHLVVYLFVQFDDSSAKGNVVDKTITDTYVLSVGQDGTLQSTFKSNSSDDSQSPKFSWIINLISSNLQDVITDVKKYAQNVASTNFKDIPAQDIQNFVFPGGKTFAFKDVEFSENQDLVSHITYVAS